MSAVPASGIDSTRAQMRRDLAELARPALVYHAWTILMIALFDLVILVLEGFDGGTLAMLAVLSVSTLAGVGIGQALAIARVRGWVLGSAAMVWYWLLCLITLPFASAGLLGGVVLAALFLVPIFVSGGVWSLASGRALFAAWVPVIYGTGAIFAILERGDRVRAWEHGDKWAIWNVGTAMILFLTIALLLVYLVQRERHRLHRWRFAPRALLAGSVIEKGPARPRLTALGWVALVAMGLLVTAGTLLMAPYLFRTEERDRPRREQQQQERGQGQQEERRGQGQGQEQAPGSPSDETAAQAERAARALAEAVCPLLIGLLIFSGMLALAWRPMRRLVVIEFLRHPPFPIPPTTRIRFGWRLVEIGIGDLGIERDPSIDASALVQRHAARLGAIDEELYERLLRAAELRDRVHYGLGIDPGDVERFLEDADRAFVIATNRIDAQTEAKNAFRDVG